MREVVGWILGISIVCATIVACFHISYNAPCPKIVVAQPDQGFGS